MMAARVNITDRAKRYRAQNNVTGPKRCVLCGSRKNLDVMHLSGNESDGDKANLAYGCRSCNNVLSTAFKNIGAGKPTNQYNPAQGVPTFEQYVWAVTHHSRGAHDEGGVVIHATPKHKRIEYARRIAESRRTRAGANEEAEDRWNPGLFSKSRHFTRRGSGPFHEVGSPRKSPSELNDDFLKKETGKSGKPAPPSTSRYKGYTISRTDDGEFFSSLDPSSWFETKAKAQRHIDGYLKGRSNPGSWDLARYDSGSAGYQRAKDAHASAKARGLKVTKVEKDGIGRWFYKYQYPQPDAQMGLFNPAQTNPVEFSTSDKWQAETGAKDLKRKGHVGVKIVKRTQGEAYRTHGAYKPVYVVTSRGQLKRNPADASAEVFEEFHGYPPNEIVTVKKEIHHHAHLAAAGKLTQLDVWGVDGKGHKITGFKGALLCFNETKNQLFVEGGDQSINLADFGIKRPREVETLGKVTDIGYQTNKTHLGDEGGDAVYVHRFTSTNDNGKHVIVKVAREPDLIYDGRNEQLLFSGGSYEILREGIDR